MASGLAKRDLLYLSDDGDGNVYVYSFPAAKLQGTLTGLSFPTGECVDEAGDVWIVEEGTNDIVEYCARRQRPDRYVDRSEQRPRRLLGRSDDRENLAVANAQTLSAGPGRCRRIRTRSGHTDALHRQPG